ncbi:MAG: IS66 family transposase, partial [Terriglobales bacterium]
AYARYAATRPAVTHAQCWSHTRRYFERAQASDPQVQEGLALIAALYHQEAGIRAAGLTGAAKQRARTAREAPIVRAFWAWCERQCQRPDLEPSHPLAKALAYAQARQVALEVCLADPEVPLDTNHLERALRPIPMGRKAWLFCWTEVGAEAVAIVQSLITTCRLHGVDPYTYLVDVLQRVQIQPAQRVQELTPRLWKQHFAAHPLRSDLERSPPAPAPPAVATAPPTAPACA